MVHLRLSAYREPITPHISVRYAQDLLDLERPYLA